MFLCRPFLLQTSSHSQFHWEKEGWVLLSFSFGLPPKRFSSFNTSVICSYQSFSTSVLHALYSPRACFAPLPLLSSVNFRDLSVSLFYYFQYDLHSDPPPPSFFLPVHFFLKRDFMYTLLTFFFRTLKKSFSNEIQKT